MEQPKLIGLPPPKDAPAAPVSPNSMWMARGINLFGLVSPAGNLGLVFVARPDRRWFGVAASAVCTAVFIYATSTHRPALAWIAAGAHYALVVTGLIHPLAVSAVGDAWAGFGVVLGKVMAYPIFAIVYYLVVTPTALIMRVLGKDPLQRNAPPKDSYWTPHEPPAKERYERQF